MRHDRDGQHDRSSGSRFDRRAHPAGERGGDFPCRGHYGTDRIALRGGFRTFFRAQQRHIHNRLAREVRQCRVHSHPWNSALESSRCQQVKLRDSGWETHLARGQATVGKHKRRSR